MDNKLQIILDEIKGLRKSQDEFKQDLQQLSAKQDEFKDSQENFKRELSILSNKQDETKSELHAALAETKSELNDAIIETKSELHAALADTKTEIKGEFEELKLMLKHNTALMIESQFVIRKDLRVGLQSTNSKIDKLSKSIMS